MTEQFRVIPGAGTYLQDQANAQSAYERAKAQLMAQRTQKQTQAGLSKDYSVDPQSQYGTYQQMLQGQGSELGQAEQSAQERGFFGAGLGNQAESALRYGHAVQNLGFKNQMADYENLYQTGMSDLERARNDAMLAALQKAADYAAQQEDYTPYDPYGGGGDGGGGGAQEPTYPDEFVENTAPINLGMELPPGFNIPPIKVRPGTKPIKLSPTFMKPKAKPATRANPYSGNPAHRLPVKKAAPPKKAPSKTSGNPMHRPTPVKKAAPSKPRGRK